MVHSKFLQKFFGLFAQLLEAWVLRQTARGRWMGIRNGHDDLLFVTARCPRVGLKRRFAYRIVRIEIIGGLSPARGHGGVRYATKSIAWPAASGARSLGGGRQKILLALDGFGEPLEQQRQILLTVYKIDFRGVDHQQVTGGVVEEKVFIDLRHLFDVNVTDGLFLSHTLAA